MKQTDAVGEICVLAASCKNRESKKRYKITKNKFCQVYQQTAAQGGGYVMLAEKLSCSVHYVRRAAKKYSLSPLGQHGGKRANSGGKREKAESKSLEYALMMRQLKIDQRVNSVEVNIRPGVAIGSKDYFLHASSVYQNNECLIRQAGLPRRLKAILAKT